MVFRTAGTFKCVSLFFLIMDELFTLKKNQLLKLLAIIALSDGHISKSNNSPKSLRLVTSEHGDDQHNFFNFLSEQLYSISLNKRSRRDKITGQNMLISDLNSKHNLSKLYLLSPEFNTTPGKKSEVDFLNSPQPTIKFVFGDSNELKWFALRTYFDFDGSISPSFKLKHKKENKNGKRYEYFQVQFECEVKISETNPSLVNDLAKLCAELGLLASIRKDKRNWSNLSGICISEINSVKRFLEFGGPMTNVKISGKSNRFEGLSKKVLCERIKLLILNKKFKHSKSFKNKLDAIKYREKIKNSIKN